MTGPNPVLRGESATPTGIFNLKVNPLLLSNFGINELQFESNILGFIILNNSSLKILNKQIH